MSKEVTLPQELNPFFDSFSTGFETLYRQLEPQEQVRLLRLVPTMFRKWCYAPLLDETILSPSNLVANHYGEDSLFSPEIAVDQTVFTYHIRAINLQAHPFLEDMQTALSLCAPYADIDEEGKLLPPYAQTILKQLHSQDIFYREYLVLLLQELNLLQPMPALYRKLVRPAENWNTFFLQPTMTVWQEIIQAALSLAAKQFEKGLSHLSLHVTKEMLEDFLLLPGPVDELYLALYDLVGIDHTQLSALMEREKAEGLDEMENFLYNASMYFGVVIDRWFLAPFGHYLRLLQPLYLQHYDFTEEVCFICSGLAMDSEASLEVFSPCLFYDFTPLGAALLATEDSEKSKQSLTQKLPLYDIWAAYRLSRAAEEGAAVEQNKAQKAMDIYTLKIALKHQPTLWKVLQWKGEESLHSLHQELLLLFDLSDGDTFCFTIEGIEYSASKKGKLRIRESAGTSLSALGLAHGTSFTYCPAISGEPALSLTILSISKGKPYLRYSRLIDQSEALTEFEKSIY